MSNIYFMCENCGIETSGITIVNGMKFCAKCYHQIFGKDNQQTEITQLKQQLVEKQNTIDEINKEFVQAVHDWKVLCAKKDKEISKLQASCQQVKIQLAIQELEKLKASADKWFDSWENSKYKGNIYDKLDVSNAYLQMSCEIDQQIKELKGE